MNILLMKHFICARILEYMRTYENHTVDYCEHFHLDYRFQYTQFINNKKKSIIRNSFGNEIIISVLLIINPTMVVYSDINSE